MNVFLTRLVMTLSYTSIIETRWVISKLYLLGTFVMDGVPHGNFNIEAQENHSVKLYTQESARNLSLHFHFVVIRPLRMTFSRFISASPETGQVRLKLV